MRRAIDGAGDSVRLEMYIYHPDGPGLIIRDALVRAARRGVTVQVLVDALGSDQLTAGFWEPLTTAGGACRWFNPLELRRMTFRDHRKLLVCDERVAILGGFNLMPEIVGNGIEQGWRDVALQLESPLASLLAEAFDQMFALADFRHPPFTKVRKLAVKRARAVADADLLLTGPGRGRNPFKTALHRDLASANEVMIATPYFLPTWRIRHLLARAARRGGRVQILLPAKSDIWLSQLASRRLYAGLMRAGVELHEYQPQVLHAKLIIVDGVTYLGSANLDRRSLHINYELMVRFEDAGLARQARDRFADDLSRSRRVNPKEWRKSRTFWAKLTEQWAWAVLVQLDPWIARWQLRRIGRG